MPENTRPIIIKKITVEGRHGHHGGAWKVAYADFVTAMMAFFLLLWLLSTSSEDRLKGLAEYFSESIMETGPPGGVGGVLRGVSVTPNMVPQSPASPLAIQPTLPFQETDSIELGSISNGTDDNSDKTLMDAALERAEEQRQRERFEQAKAAIIQAIRTTPELEKLKESLIFEQTPEGLRIQILDRDNYAMFPVGSNQMYPHTRQLLSIVAQAIRALPNRLSVRGHTDSRPFPPAATYDNWSLSTDRANATRRALVEFGFDSRRISEIIGKADSEHLFPADPTDSRNRRISVVLLNEVRPVASPPVPERPRS